MGPKAITATTEDIFRSRMDDQLNPFHSVIRLDGRINWAGIDALFRVHLTSQRGRPALTSLLLAGLPYLQQCDADNAGMKKAIKTPSDPGGAGPPGSQSQTWPMA
jgi:hypothetical protein